MEKLKIGNTEFDLVPMGISEDTQRKTRSFRFTSQLSNGVVYDIVSAITTEIQHIGNDGKVSNTYADIASFKGLLFEKDVIVEDGVIADVYTVTYSVDAVEKELGSIRTQLIASHEEVTELNNQIDDLSNTIVIISIGNMSI